MSDSPKMSLPRRKSRLHRFGLAFLVLTLVLVCGLAGTVYMLIGQTLRAPDWVQDRIEARIDQNLGDLKIGFSDIEFVLRKGWRPRLRLRNAALRGGDGQTMMQLSNAEVSMAMRPLLRGQIQPKQIYLSGGFATLRKDAEGRISLIGEGASPINQAPNLAVLFGQFGDLFNTPNLAALTSVEIESLSLRYEDLTQRRAWTLDGGRILLNRKGTALTGTSSFSLLGGSDVASLVEAEYSTVIGDIGAKFSVSVRDIAAGDIAAQGVALNWLGVLKAPISGSLRGSVLADGKLGPLRATLEIGAGVVQPNEVARPIPFTGAHSYFTYDPAEQVLEFNELAVDSAWGSGRIEGRAYLGDLSGGRPNSLIGQFTLNDLALNPDGLYKEPLKIGQSTADFRLELNPFRFSLGQLQIEDGDSRLLVSGELDAGGGGWSLAMDAQLNEITPERLVEIWPDGAVPGTRNWTRDNLKGGILRDINLAVRVKPGLKPNIFADFDYQDAQITFLPTMPPITGAAGQASLIGNRFVVTATSGKVTPDQGGAIDVAGTSFIVPDVTIKPGAPGIVRMIAGGEVTSVMSLLNRPPLQVLKDTPLPVDLATGQARVSGTLSLPLKPRVPAEEITFHFKGEITNVSSGILVPDRMLTADSLTVTGDQSEVIVSGAGAIDGIAADVRWRQPLGVGASKNSRVEGTIELSQEAVETFDLGLPKGSVGGKGTGKFTLDLAAGEPPALKVTSDLTGLRLSLPEIGWLKGESTAGELSVSARLGAGARIDSLVLRGGGLSATGTISIRPEGGLDRAAFSSVRMGNWLDAQVDLIGRGNATPALKISGGTLDMRSAEFGGNSAPGAETTPMDVSLNRLQVTDTIALTGFTGTFNTAGGLNGRFQGLVNGQTPVTGIIAPQDGGSAVQVQADDAGGVFRSAGILQQARGGAFGLTLLPAGEPGQFNGTLRVTNTRIKDAPAIAALVNSISVIGLVDELSGQGIQFTEVDAKFGIGPSQLTLYSSSAVGPSIGISMDGTYDVASSRLNMRGVISPVYMINAIGSVLTRKGEGLIGFNYHLRGTAQDPSVSVNPLSALAPGMLRDIFRKPSPRPPGEDAPAPSRVPDPADRR